MRHRDVLHRCLGRLSEGTGRAPPARHRPRLGEAVPPQDGRVPGGRRVALRTRRRRASLEEVRSQGPAQVHAPYQSNHLKVQGEEGGMIGGC